MTGWWLLSYHTNMIETATTARYIGKCAYPGCKNFVVREAKAQGPMCHGSTRWTKVVGVENAEIRCTASCRNAKRAECECECGGKHHAEGWL